MVGISFSGTVLPAVGVAVRVSMLVQLLASADSQAGRVPVDMAVAGAMFVTVLPLVLVTVFAGMLVAMVTLMSRHDVLRPLICVIIMNLPAGQLQPSVISDTKYQLVHHLPATARLPQAWTVAMSGKSSLLL